MLVLQKGRFLQARPAIFSRLHLSNTIVRFQSTPLIKSYSAWKSPISFFWATRIPTIAKAFSGCLAAALSLTHIHPDILITVTPPLAGAGYFLWRKIERLRFNDAVALATRNTTENGKISVPVYDESDLDLALKGIDSEYGYFLSVVLPKVERQLVDFVIEHHDDTMALQSMIDENGQVNVCLGTTPETFVTLKAENPLENGEENLRTTVSDVSFSKFIVFSIPLYDTKDPLTRNRLGVLQVSMLECESDIDDKCNIFNMGVRLWPYTFRPTAIVIT